MPNAKATSWTRYSQKNVFLWTATIRGGDFQIIETKKSGVATLLRFIGFAFASVGSFPDVDAAKAKAEQLAAKGS